MLGENKEKKIAIIAVLVLLSTLVLIYIFYFATKGKKVADKADEIAQIQQKEQQEVNTGVLNQTGSGLLEDILSENDESSGNTSTGKNLTGDELKKKEEEELAFLESDTKVHTGSTILTGNHDQQTSTGKTLESTKQTPAQTQTTVQKNIRKFVGTQLYTGKLDILDELNLKYDYILKDSNNIYFVKLAANFGNIDEKAKKMGGNTVEIKDKNIIKENMLFGDKVIYLNLSKYYKQKVFIVAKFDGVNEYRLVQVDFDKYYSLKSYLKSLFIF